MTGWLSATQRGEGEIISFSCRIDGESEDDIVGKAMTMLSPRMLRAEVRIGSKSIRLKRRAW